MARFFDLDLLNTLVVIAETGSLSAAAPRLFSTVRSYLLPWMQLTVRYVA